MQGTQIITRPFVDALSHIPIDTPYKHHGRDIATGLDCVGIILWIYRSIGLSVDCIDTPYGERDYLRSERTKRMAERLRLKFRITSAVSPDDCLDGDVLLLGEGSRLIHCAIAIDGMAVQMAGRTRTLRGRHQIVGGRLMRVPLRKAWPWVSQCWRHGTLFSEQVIG